MTKKYTRPITCPTCSRQVSASLSMPYKQLPTIKISQHNATDMPRVRCVRSNTVLSVNFWPDWALRLLGD